VRPKRFAPLHNHSPPKAPVRVPSSLPPPHPPSLLLHVLTTLPHCLSTSRDTHMTDFSLACVRRTPRTSWTSAPGCWRRRPRLLRRRTWGCARGAGDGAWAAAPMGRTARMSPCRPHRSGPSLSRRGRRAATTTTTTRSSGGGNSTRWPATAPPAAAVTPLWRGASLRAAAAVEAGKRPFQL